jgi:long-chain acyl-CoA synthetase
MSFPSIVSVESIEPASPTESGVHRSALAPDGVVCTPVKDGACKGYGIAAQEGFRYDTVVGCFEATAQTNGSNRFLGHRAHKDDGSRGDYVWCTYKEAFDDVAKYGAGLSKLCSIKATEGISGDTGQPRVGVYSINRPEVTKVILTLFQRRLICCPLYDTLGPKSVQFILDQADVKVVFCERSKLKSLLVGKGKNLEHVVLFEDLTDEDREAAKAAAVSIHSLSDLKTEAGDTPEPPPKTVPDDWAYIMYTSGTTGDPKGVCLSHRNMLAAVSGLIRGNTERLVRSSDVYVSYLPMAHSMEVVLQVR